MREMAENFKQRHRSGKCSPEDLTSLRAVVPALGGSYCRYSCDNSSPLSIVDQLANILDRARADGFFIPWSYVFADYSISGLDKSRQGYSSYKAILMDLRHGIQTTFIDDFTRASRDEIQWWRLAADCKRLGKNLVGASDNFNLADPNSDIEITMYGLLSRLLIKGLREKVRRGMKGTADRGGCLGKLPLGLTRHVKRDESGHVVLRPDGRPKYEAGIDPVTAEYAQLMFRLFTKDRESAYKITQRFNSLKVDGWAGWNEATIKKLLGNPAFIGVLIWNRTRREFDWEEDKWIAVQNPRSEWRYSYDPALALISLEEWSAAQERLAQMRADSPLTGRKVTRNQISASTLFSGTLQCGYCGHELTLNRSAGAYQNLYCLNGPTGRHECKLTTSKSTRVIELCLLGYIQDVLINEESIDGLLVKANEFLENEAAKPPVKTAGQRAALQRHERAIAKLMTRITLTDEMTLIAAYEKEVLSHQRDADRLAAEIAQADHQNAAPPPPLDRARVKGYVADLRQLLNQNVPAAAEAIRALTGMITITQEPIPGRKNGAKWIATFQPDLTEFLKHAASVGDYPESITLEHLSARNWIMSPEVKVHLEHVPQYERLGASFKQFYDSGTTLPTIAAAHGMSTAQATEILRFGQTGERPHWKNHYKTGQVGKAASEPIYTKIAIPVAELRDGEQLSWPSIQRRVAQTAGIKCCEATIKRAYDHAHRDDALNAAKQGQDLYRGPSKPGGPKKSAIR
jgi:DNA invertase Pin-like site-specific DNA recombinase